MEAVVELLVHQGSYLLLFAALVVAGIGVPLPEDLVMISGAILAQRGITSLPVTVAVLAAGVFAGDTVLYFFSRRVGTAVYEWRLVKRVLPPARRKWIEEKIEKHGGLVVFCARHVAGFRGPTFALAAIHGISYPRFIFWDMLGTVISLPLWMGIGWFFGDSIDQLMNHTATAERVVTVAAVGVVLLGLAIHAVVNALRRRRSAAATADAAPEASEPAADDRSA
jgi:membrane protein DedA with SNARE-associated domain